MTSHDMLRLRLTAALLAGAGCFLSVPAAAQPADDAGPALSGYLQTLAANPRDVEALIGAGNAANELGDPRAAITFFGRAEEARPNDGRSKAGIGTALVQLEQPREALDFFEQAVRLGVPDYEIGRERGLAYDLLGDPRRAQRDYRMALQRGGDDELRERLALSLAISGDKQAALDTIDAQVRRQDRSAWRTRAFILALTGDSLGATQAAAGVMSADQASAMRPFFAALPGLTPAQRATAVHFGDIPSDGRGTQIAGGFQSASPSFPLVADEVSGSLDRDRRAPPAPSIETRRRPDAAGSAIAEAASTRQPARERAATVPSPATATPPAGRASGSVTGTRPTDLPERAGPPAPLREVASTSNAPVSNLASPAAEVRSSALPEPAVPRIETASSSPPPTPGISAIDLAPSTPVLVSAQPSPTAATEPGERPMRFADLASAIATLEDAPPAPKPTAVAKPAAKPEKKAAPVKKVPPKPTEPSRYWVQIAGGADKGSLPREFKRLKEKAPKLLGGRSAWTAPLRATNRLLVGPFKSNAEAQAFVNQLTKSELSGFSWTSEEGQKIEKLAGT